MKLPDKSKISSLARRPNSTPVKKEKTIGAKVSSKTVEEHRREIIGRARKYIYPLKPSNRKIILMSTSLLLAAIIIFLGISALLLYKFQSDSTLIYRVTQVVPFPVAKAGGGYVSYENYLFEVRHYVHYYEYRNQQPVDFSSQSGQNQLNHYKHEALKQVVNLAYAKQLANSNNIKVSRQDVDQTLAVAKGRLGGNQQEFASVLNSFWGWSVSDYRRELRQELLMEKVASALDTSARQKANTVLTDLKSGSKFSVVAKKYSDDKATKNSGGKYHERITQSNTDLPPEVVAAAFKLKKGQVSGVINAGYSLEIIKLLGEKDGALELAHIQINLAPIGKYIQPLKTKSPPSYYISLPKST